MYGRLVLFKTEKGFGFIRVASGEDFFCHISDFPPGSQPYVGMAVEFRAGTRKGRELAVDIKPLGEADAEQGVDSPPGSAAEAQRSKEVHAVLGGVA